MKFSEEEKAMWLEDWRQSGKSAWAYAKTNGLNPKGQDGTAWDGNILKVYEIYDQYYQNKRTSTPTPGTAGYVFMYFNDKGPAHMELYDYTGKCNDYTIYETDGIKQPVSIQVSIETSEKVFVPLNVLKPGNIPAF